MSISSPSFSEIHERGAPPAHALDGSVGDASGAKVLAARYTALFVFERLGLDLPNIVDVRSGAILVARVADEAIEQGVLDVDDVASLRDAPVGEALDRLVVLLTRELGRLDDLQ